MKAKRSFMNLIYGLLSQLLIISLGVLIPRLFLVNFGSEVNGFINSINQIIVYLSLLEAGVGAASLQALYRYAANNDRKHINEILAATSIYYKKTGMYYFLCVILLAIIYPISVKSSIDWSTTMIVILLTGMGGAFNYYFQGTYQVFVTALGKSYVDTIITTIINVVTSITKIILILLGCNIIIIQCSFFVLTMCQIVIYFFYIKKNYKWLQLNCKPNYKAISQKNSVLIHQLSYLIFNNTDVLILTLFTNLKVVSVYVIYNMLFSVIDRVVNIVNNSVTFVLGQTYYGDKKKFLKLFDAYEVYLMALVFSFFSVAYILILPFMKLYTSGINDINYIDIWLPIFFITIKLLSNARFPSNTMITIAGHFRKTQYRSILESLINIVFSLLFVHLMGMYGVLIGTICALLYRSIDMIIYANMKILKRSPWKTAKRWVSNVIIFIIITTIVKISPTSYLSMMLWACLLITVILPIYFTISSLLERNVFYFSKQIFIANIAKLRKRVSTK